MIMRLLLAGACLPFLLLAPIPALSQTLECPANNANTRDAVRLSVAVVPQLPPLELFKRWTPLLQMVSARTGLCFHLLIPKTIPEFEALFLKGEPDIAFLNPYHQVMAHDAQGYVPMLADSKPLTGIIVVRRDSTVQGIKDLNRQTIAFPAPNAFAASLLLRAILTESKIDFRAQYVQTHSNVYRAVAAGTLAAGGGVNNTLAREPQALRDELRVLYESPGFRSHPLSAHPRVPPKVRQEFSNAIFQLALFDQGKNLLNQVQLPDPSAATHRDDYAPLERLGVQRFVVSDN